MINHSPVIDKSNKTGQNGAKKNSLKKIHQCTKFIFWQFRFKKKIKISSGQLFILKVKKKSFKKEIINFSKFQFWLLDTTYFTS